MVALNFIVGLRVQRPRFLDVPLRSWASHLTLWTCLLTWKTGGEVVTRSHELGGSFPALVVDLDPFSYTLQAVKLRLRVAETAHCAPLPELGECGGAAAPQGCIAPSASHRGSVS